MLLTGYDTGLTFVFVNLTDGSPIPAPPPPPTPSTPYFMVKNSWGTSWGEKVSGHTVLSWQSSGLAGPLWQTAYCSLLQLRQHPGGGSQPSVARGLLPWPSGLPHPNYRGCRRATLA